MLCRVRGVGRCCQDLPFTYRFGYTIDSNEWPLVSQEQLGNTYSGFLLPAGSTANNGVIGLVAYVTTQLGAVARSTIGADFATNVTVRCSSVSGNSSSAVALLQASTEALLGLPIQQGQLSSVLNNVAVMAQVRLRQRA